MQLRAMQGGVRTWLTTGLDLEPGGGKPPIIGRVAAGRANSSGYTGGSRAGVENRRPGAKARQGEKELAGVTEANG
jgi:hypothetical protein